MKILLIEDEGELAASISDYLKSNQVICEGASTLASALDKIHLYDYDCILLDLNLPRRDGQTHAADRVHRLASSRTVDDVEVGNLN